MLVSPSILSADFSKLGNEIKEIENAGANWLHIDVMDGNFVPNISIGVPVIKSIRKITDIPFDIHLMIEKPEKLYMDFIKAGADILTVHAEATNSLYRLVNEIKKHCKVGVALNPSSPLCMLENIIDEVDLILVMTVEPGFAEQKFIEGMVKKIEKAKEMIGDRNILISVDGGINDRNVGLVKKAGASVIVSGSYIFKSKDYRKAVESLRI